MSKASVLLCACVALLAIGCRPSEDRSEAQQAGAVATGGTPVTSGGNPVKRGAEDVTAETLPENLATVAAGSPDQTQKAASNRTATAPAPTIPVRYRGRWGMVPADCTSTRGDAKGLIRVGERTIRFYEATATLQAQRPAIATSFSGDFAFTGEGQTWAKEMTLAITGDTLTRTEEDGTFTYTRCAS